MMNRIFSILIFSFLCFGFIACSDDNDDPAPLDAQIEDSHSYIINVIVAKGAPINNPVELKLEDFSKLKDISRVRKAEVTTTSSITIRGIEKGKYHFKDLTLKIDNTDIKQTYTNISLDKKSTTKSDLDFLNKIAEELVRKKKITLRLSGETEKEILKDVKAEIKLDVIFE